MDEQEMNLLFIDVETTGLSPRKHEIIELAACIEIDQVVQCGFVLYFRPEKWDTISKEALAVNGWTAEQLKELPGSHHGYCIFVEMLRLAAGMIPGATYANAKFTIVEHSKNGNFDIEFLKEFLGKRFSNFFKLRPINTRDLVKRKFPREKNFALKDCARLLKIPFDDKKHHGALYDMQVMREIYRRCS